MRILIKSHTAGRLTRPAYAVYRTALLSAVVLSVALTGCSNKMDNAEVNDMQDADRTGRERQSTDTEVAAELSETVIDDEAVYKAGTNDSVADGAAKASADVSDDGIIINIVTDNAANQADDADGGISGRSDSNSDDRSGKNGGSTGSEKAAGDAKAVSKSVSYLSDLKNIPAGTVLDAGSIDTSYLSNYFNVSDIEEGDSVFKRINGKSYRTNDYVPLSSLVYLKLPHYNFDGDIQVGELIVCRDITDDVVNVFTELFEAEYQIQSMYLVDNYWTGDPDTTDSASIDVNNTSCFCFRNATAGSNLSNHAYGRAIDINPQQNPYVSYKTGSPVWSHSNADAYIDRSTGLPHVITHEDTAYKIFTKYGFGWGGDWSSPKDYQHFEKKRR